MSNYTTELRFVCETLAGLDESKGYNSVDDIIYKSREKIFSFNYPIFDSAYKSTLETKIIKHYYTRELCAETFGRWKLFLDARMNEIMPKYNKLYESELLSFNPFYDADYTKTGNRDTDSSLTDKQVTVTDDDSVVTDNTQNANVTGGTDVRTLNTENGGTDVVHGENAPKSDQWTYYSETPQGGVDGLEENRYLTTAEHVVTSGEGSEDDTATTYGKTTDTVDTNNYGKTSTTKNTGTTTTNTDINVTADRNTNSKTGEDYAERVIGKMPGKSYASLLQEFRETFLNIDLMVINELSDLFFGLWE